jgi:proteasome lid subunit RPN8/RPN11|tara:strand:- start:535 stop:855 length:321 start_codon:yes stop_codon:yes gene_type:complete
MINHLLPQIYEHLENQYPKEGCGIITDELKWFPVTNVAKVNTNFIMDMQEYTKIALKYKIKGIVHSHLNLSAEPSEFDKKQCNGLNLDYFIISLPSKELYHLRPEK